MVTTSGFPSSWRIGNWWTCQWTQVDKQVDKLFLTCRCLPLLCLFPPGWECSHRSDRTTSGTLTKIWLILGCSGRPGFREWTSRIWVSDSLTQRLSILKLILILIVLPSRNTPHPKGEPRVERHLLDSGMRSQLSSTTGTEIWVGISPGKIVMQSYCGHQGLGRHSWGQGEGNSLHAVQSFLVV